MREIAQFVFYKIECSFGISIDRVWGDSAVARGFSILSLKWLTGLMSVNSGHMTNF